MRTGLLLGALALAQFATAAVIPQNLNSNTLKARDISIDDLALFPEYVYDPTLSVEENEEQKIIHDCVPYVRGSKVIPNPRCIKKIWRIPGYNSWTSAQGEFTAFRDPLRRRG